MSNNSNVPAPAPVPNLNTVLLPITNTTLTGISIANITVNNFLDITLNAIIGPNSNISIVKPGQTPITYTGTVNTILHLGSDISNKLPFVGNQTINIIFNAAPNETIFINKLTYVSSKIVKPINYKQLLFIFLIVFFIINIFI